MLGVTFSTVCIVMFLLVCFGPIFVASGHRLNVFIVLVDFIWASVCGGWAPPSYF